MGEAAKKTSPTQEAADSHSATCQRVLPEFQKGEALHYSRRDYCTTNQLPVKVIFDSAWTSWDSKTFYKLYKADDPKEVLTNYARSENLHKPGTQNEDCELCKKQLV